MKKNLAPVIAIFGGMLLIIYAIGESGGTFLCFGASPLYLLPSLDHWLP